AFVFEPNRSHDLAVDVGGLLAAAQIFNRFVAPLRNHPERDAAAGAAAVQTEHEARLFRRATMVERVDAQRAVFADQARRNLLDDLEARPPHQRSVAENPQVVSGGFGSGGDFSGHFQGGLSEHRSETKQNSLSFGTPPTA